MSNIALYNSHIQTLCELKEIAEKHNCHIHMGVNNIFDRGIDLANDFKCPETIQNELESKCTFCDDEVLTEGTIYWFELYDNNTKESHTLEYHDITYKAVLELDYSEELSEETQEWVEEHLSEWQDISSDKWELYSTDRGTVMYGFTGLEKPNVYREGMLLKFFGDLVCDYLKEPRIIRTY